MRKVLLLLTICAAFYCKAQQKQSDSLLNELKKHSADDTNRINLLNQLSKAHLKQDLNKSLVYADSAVVLAKRLGNRAKLAEAYMLKQNAFASQEDYKTCIVFCNLALQQLLLSDNKKKLAECYSKLSSLYYATADYIMGLKHAQSGLTVSSLISDSNLMAHNLNLIGVNYEYMSNYSKALENFLQSLQLYQKLQNKAGAAKVYGNIGTIYYNMKEYEEAINYTLNCCRVLKEVNDSLWLAAGYNNLGSIYLENGSYRNCIKYNLLALQLNKIVKSRKGTGNNLMDMGAAYIHLKNYDSGFLCLNAAIEIYEKLGAKNNTATALGHLSYAYTYAPNDILLKMKIKPSQRFIKALQAQQRAISLTKETKDLKNEMEQWKILAAVYKEKQEYKKALKANEQYVLLHDGINNDKNKKEIFVGSMQYAFEQTQDSIKAINEKKQAFAAAEINKQKVIRNASISMGGILLLAAITSLVFYKRKKDFEIKKNEAEFKARVSETEMKALRAQMNPHFIFNSLNSIADYIDKNQMQIASDFTVKFAKLMRMVLENSEQKEIVLADDLKALELYMQLERLRLKNKFYYQIIVDDAIDKENTLVPPLILQPFVENSIWHGVSKKEGHGNITISITKDDGMIHCIVEDDGSGIDNAESVSREKKSLGMRITKARIDIINKIKNANASMHIYNKEKGVRVEVKLPLELSF